MGGVTVMNTKPTRDVNTAIKIQCVMTRLNISQRDLAAKAGVTFQMINKTIWGTGTSKAVQKDIAKALGFESWEELKNHREVV